jgi:hypothetical protein
LFRRVARARRFRLWRLAFATLVRTAYVRSAVTWYCFAGAAELVPLQRLEPDVGLLQRLSRSKIGFGW